MIRVALSQRICYSPDLGELRDCLDERLTQLLMSVDILPIPMPNFLERDDDQEAAFHAWLEEISPAGIILTGGDDPRIRDHRWRAERALIDHARSRNLPLLGICRGMQRLALEDGGTIAAVEGHVDVRHVVTARRVPVNSFHDFAIVSLPQMWAPIAVADDGVLEAMAHLKLPWQGWMWHPERELPFSEEDIYELTQLFGSVCA